VAVRTRSMARDVVRVMRRMLSVAEVGCHRRPNGAARNVDGAVARVAPPNRPGCRSPPRAVAHEGQVLEEHSVTVAPPNRLAPDRRRLVGDARSRCGPLGGVTGAIWIFFETQGPRIGEARPESHGSRKRGRAWRRRIFEWCAVLSRSRRRSTMKKMPRSLALVGLCGLLLGGCHDNPANSDPVGTGKDCDPCGKELEDPWVLFSGDIQSTCAPGFRCAPGAVFLGASGVCVSRTTSTTCSGRDLNGGTTEIQCTYSPDGHVSCQPAPE
jgi:hypothetical protein